MRSVWLNENPVDGADARRALWLGCALGGACALIWGVQAIVSKRSVADGLTAADVTILRSGVSGLLLLPVALRLKPIVVGFLGWRRLIILTALVGSPYSLLIVGGVAFAPALHNTVIGLGLMPLLSVGIARMVFGERLSSGQFVGIGLAMAGFVVFSKDAMSAAPIRDGAWVGDLMFVATASMWATFGALSKHWRTNAIAASAGICVLSLLTLPILVALLPVRLANASISAIALQGFYQGILVSGISLMLYTRTVVLLGPVNAAMFVPLAPIVTTVCEAVFGEPPTPFEAVGALAVALGMMMALKSGPAAIAVKAPLDESTCGTAASSIAAKAASSARGASSGSN